MKIPTITLHQPWATMIAKGAKEIETRSWKAPNYLIGNYLAIHAGKTYTAVNLPEFTWWTNERMGAGWQKDMPAGAVVAIVRLDSCRQVLSNEDVPDMPEQIFGDFRRGRWMWKLSNVIEVDPPVEAIGKQGIWKCELSITGAMFLKSVGKERKKRNAKMEKK